MLHAILERDPLHVFWLGSGSDRQNVPRGLSSAQLSSDSGSVHWPGRAAPRRAAPRCSAQLWPRSRRDRLVGEPLVRVGQ
jgi:hypothetical protein